MTIPPHRNIFSVYALAIKLLRIIVVEVPTRWEHRSTAYSRSALKKCFAISTSFHAHSSTFSFFELPYIVDAMKELSHDWEAQLTELKHGRTTFAPIETHNDGVFKLPTNATLLTSSSNTPIESYVIGTSVLCVSSSTCLFICFVLGTQFHPEFTGSIVANELIPHVRRFVPSFTLPPATAEVPPSLQADPSLKLSPVQARFTPSEFTNALLTSITRYFLK